MITEMEGSLFYSDAPVIAHQVNCMGVMGRGIAQIIRERFPEVFQSYQRQCGSLQDSGKKDLLGKVLLVKNHEGVYIANCFAQYRYGTSSRYTDYDAFRTCFVRLHNWAVKNEVETIAIPYKIGCGNGGGDWSEVYQILEGIFKDSEVTLEIYRYSSQISSL